MKQNKAPEVEYRKKLNLDEVREFIKAQTPETKIYIGGDSERFRMNGVWYAEYTIVVVVHYDGCRGAKLFGEVTRMRDYDQQKNRPALRLMNEVYKISEMFLELQDDLKDREVEIHMDINPANHGPPPIGFDQPFGFKTHRGCPGSTWPLTFPAICAVRGFKVTHDLSP